MTHLELMEENARLREQLAEANDWGCEDCDRYDEEKAQPVVWCHACYQKVLNRAATFKERLGECLPYMRHKPGCTCANWGAPCNCGYCEADVQARKLLEGGPDA